MPHDNPLLKALAQAVEADPSNLDLRAHYAEQLLQNNLPQEALGQCAATLALRPDHLAALRLAIEAAEKSDQPILATSYRRIYESLGMDSTKKLLGDLEPESTKEPTRLTSHGKAESEKDEDELALDDLIDQERPKITLQDVAGMEKVKKRLWLSFLGPMKDARLREMYKKSLRGGLLLYGPPGCGKTYMARALAGELGARFYSVGLNDILDMWLGESEKKLNAIFETARRQAPSVLFFDELDALGRKRSLTRDHAGRTTINQLLHELDGANADNEGVYIVAATNHPWDVDAALRRPGRLDRTVLVLPPDLPARQSILDLALKDRPTKKIDTVALAKKTEDWSGADLVHLVDSATEFAMESAYTTGNPREIEMGDFKKALGEMKPSVRSWFETARNFAVYGNEGGIYDDLVEYLKEKRLI